MAYLIATLQTLGAHLDQRARERIRAATDRGSVTIEQVLWAIAVIAIAGIVIAAVTSYVRTKSGLIK